MSRDVLRAPPPCDNGGNPCPPPPTRNDDPPDVWLESVCDPAWCTLYLPSDAEFSAIVAEANRIIEKYGNDMTTTGRQCAALGATMRSRVGDVRMTDYMWYATDAYGNRRLVGGDTHPTALQPGTGNVHVARGIGGVNPRGMADIVNTVRHEFGHLNGLPQGQNGVDPAGALAAACGK